MARIRTIKPEFPQSESMGKISRDSRLCFVMMWTIADDAGRLRGNSRMLASLLFPYDDDAAELMPAWLDELEQSGSIDRYEVGGSSFIQITKWLEHQKIDRPSPSRLPEFDESSRKLSKPREHSSADLGPRTRTKDQDLGEEVALSLDKAPSNHGARATRLPDDWQPALDEREYAATLGLDPERQALDFRAYWLAKAGKDARKVDWRLTWQTWCRRSADMAKARGSPAKPSFSIDDFLAKKGAAQ